MKSDEADPAVILSLIEGLFGFENPISGNICEARAVNFFLKLFDGRFVFGNDNKI